MMEKHTILERLELFASNGETCAQLKLWKSQIAKLEKEGFLITIIQETDRKAEYYCEISWKNPIYDVGDAQNLLQYTINCLNQNVVSSKRVQTPYDVKLSCEHEHKVVAPYNADL